MRDLRSTFALRILLCLFAVQLGVSKVSAQRPTREASRENTPSNEKLLTAFKEVVTAAGKSTVRVVCEGTHVALGTVVSADGYVLTKASEMKKNPTCRLRDGRTLDASIVGVHEEYDLALLKIEAKGLTAIEWRESKLAPVGNWIACVGTTDLPVAVGVVSVAARKSNGQPSNNGYLGIQMEPITDGGVKVVRVEPDTPASKAGLKANDIVVTLQGELIRDIEMMALSIQKHKPGDTVKLKVKRGEEEVLVEAQLARRPVNSRGDFQNNLGSKLSDRRSGFPNFLQHDAVIDPNNCGGPLVDLEGKAIGVNIARAGRTESYAIPSEAIASLLAELKSGKRAPK